VGADKVVIPGKFATDEDWSNVFNKLGRPESPDKYDLKLKGDITLEDEFIKGFKDTFHKAGILPKQAQQIIDFYESQTTAYADKLIEDNKNYVETNREILKDKWGEAYDAHIKYANYALKELGGETLRDNIKAVKLDSNADFLEFLAKAGKAISGDSFPGIRESSGGPLTPEEAMKQMDEIRGDKMHPINNAEHPSHEAALKSFEKLAQYAYNVKN
jgi:hypothetical protein